MKPRKSLMIIGLVLISFILVSSIVVYAAKPAPYKQDNKYAKNIKTNRNKGMKQQIIHNNQNLKKWRKMYGVGIPNYQDAVTLEELDEPKLSELEEIYDGLTAEDKLDSKCFWIVCPQLSNHHISLLAHLVWVHPVPLKLQRPDIGESLLHTIFSIFLNFDNFELFVVSFSYCE